MAASFGIAFRSVEQIKYHLLFSNCQGLNKEGKCIPSS